MEQHGEDGVQHAAAGDAASHAVLPHPPPPDRLSLAQPGKPLVNAGLPIAVGRNDYAINGGDTLTGPDIPLFPLWVSAAGDGWSGPATPADGGVDGTPVQLANARATFTQIARQATGVSYCGSMIRLSDITDGATNTYLLGEKYLCPDNYANGLDLGDNEEALMGDNEDICRWSSENSSLSSVGMPVYPFPPMVDTPGYLNRFAFGSAHVNGFQIALCDGSVRLMSYELNLETHRRLCNRHDGLTIDAKRIMNN